MWRPPGLLLVTLLCIGSVYGRRLWLDTEGYLGRIEGSVPVSAFGTGGSTSRAVICLTCNGSAPSEDVGMTAGLIYVVLIFSILPTGLFGESHSMFLGVSNGAQQT